MAKRNWRWVSRDDLPATLVDIWESAKKPEATGRQGRQLYLSDNSHSATMPAEAFAELFGVEIEPGVCVKVKFGKAKVVK